MSIKKTSLRLSPPEEDQSNATLLSNIISKNYTKRRFSRRIEAPQIGVFF